MEYRSQKVCTECVVTHSNKVGSFAAISKRRCAVRRIAACNQAILNVTRRFDNLVAQSSTVPILWFPYNKFASTRD